MASHDTGNPAPSIARQSGPTKSADRHRFVDALRGFALLGIVIVNVEYIVQPVDVGWHDATSALDRAVRWFIISFGQTKIYPIFAALFGYGLALQFNRASQTGSDDALRGRHRRRMTALVVAGVLHGILFFPGDILVIYGIIGAACFRFRHWDTRRLLKLAAWVYGVASAFWLILGLLDLAAGGTAVTGDAAMLDTLRNGSFADVVLDVHLPNWLETVFFLSILQGPAVVASFAVGMALGRTDLLSHPERHVDRVRSLLTKWSLPVLATAGLSGVLTLAATRSESIGFALGFTIAPAVAAVYLGVLGITIGVNGGRVSTLLERAGSMSLTGYLGQSVVLSTLAYGYGGGIIGIDPLGGTLVAIAVWFALTAFADVWMRRLRFGPAEWVLRTISYGQRQPIRRSAKQRTT